MFITLFVKECKIMSKSLTYYIFLFCMLFFYATQMHSYETVIEPKLNEEYYGDTLSNNTTVIMKMTLIELAKEYCDNKYSTYPYGFHKEVILNATNNKNIKKILGQYTSMPIDEIRSKVKKYESGIYYDIADDKTAIMKEKYVLDIELTKVVSYTQFIISMKEVDGILGGGSKYTSNRVKYNALVPMTYEEALSEYENFINKDHITGAYARLYCDYLGIFLGIFSVFIAVSRQLLDKKMRASDVVFVKKISSAKLILARYLSCVSMILLPVFLLSIAPMIDSLCYAYRIGTNVDALAFVKYIMVWLLPTVLITVSVGYFITELTNSPFAILVVGIWWYITVFTSSNLVGNVGGKFILRFNSIGEYNIYSNIRNEIFENRMVYSLVSMIIILLTIIIYEARRKGVLRLHGKIYENSESELET